MFVGTVFLARQPINQQRRFSSFRQRFQIDGPTGCVRAATTGAIPIQPGSGVTRKLRRPHPARPDQALRLAEARPDSPGPSL